MQAEAAQSRIVTWFGLVSPTLAVSAASRTLAGTDLGTHHRFLRQSEALRFDFVQGLNQLHSTALAYADAAARSKDPEAEARTRINAASWRLLDTFPFAPDPPGVRVARAALPVLWLTLALLLSAAATGFGIAAVREQRATIAALLEEDAKDRADALAGQEDWGGAAYAAFHLTYAPPSDFAFAAIGQRDTAPWLHLVRMLALEGQIHEADTANADFGLIGRFDFAFLAATIAPLLLILLLHDLRSGERVAGRHDLLEATAGKPSRLWLARAAVRLAGLALALLVPFWIGAAIEGAATATVLAASALACGGLAVWWLIVEVVGRIKVSSPVLLAALIGVWLSLALLVPAAARAGIEAAVPVPDGAEILMLQREAVNAAWDKPKPATMEPFLARHPQWAAFATVEQPFVGKWYYAFQQVCDQQAEPLAGPTVTAGWRATGRRGGRRCFRPPRWSNAGRNSSRAPIRAR